MRVMPAPSRIRTASAVGAERVMITGMPRFQTFWTISEEIRPVVSRILSEQSTLCSRVYPPIMSIVL